MSENDDDSQERTVVGFVVTIAVVVAIVVSLLAGFSAIWSSSNKGSTSSVSAPAASGTAPAAAAAMAAPARAGSAAVAGPVKVYFETGKTEPGPEAAGDLAAIVEAVKSQRADKAVVSGFHDKTGNADVNAEISKQRASAVASLLTAAGLSNAQIEMRKPEETMGDGKDREARRVEVTAEKS